MTARPEPGLAWRLFGYTFADSFRLRRIGRFRLLAMALLGVLAFASLADLYAGAFGQFGGAAPACRMLVTSIFGLQALLFYLGYTWAMASLYWHTELPPLLVLPIPEHLVAAAFSLPILTRAYLLEGLVAGPALVALTRTYGLPAGDGLRLTGLLLLAPPIILGLALLLLLAVMVRFGRRRLSWAAAVCGAVLLGAVALFRARAVLFMGRLWAVTAGPAFWVLGLIGLAGVLWLDRNAVAAWWTRGRELLTAGEGRRTQHPAGEFHLAGGRPALTAGALVRREWARFFGVPVYVTNYTATAAVGILLPVVISRPVGELGAQVGWAAGAPTLQTLTAFFLLAVQGMMSSGSLTAFSRDGAEWWVLRSLPLPLPRLITAKLIANGVLDLAGALPTLAAVQFLFPLPALSRVLLVLAALLSTCLMTALKLGLDAANPFLDWTEPLQPMRTAKRYVGYGLNAALVTGCAAIAAAVALLTGFTPAGFLLLFAAVATTVLCVQVAFLIRLARRSEAGRSQVFRRLVEQA